MAQVTERTRAISTQKARPSGSFELHAWYFMRVSGLFLVVLALTHWTIMHFINRLGVESSKWIIGRYQNIFWPTFDAVLLVFAMLHGTNGMRTLIDDYVHNGAWNMFWKGVLYAASFIFIVFGLITIFLLPHVAVK